MGRLLILLLGLGLGTAALASGNQVLSVSGQVERLEGEQPSALRTGASLPDAFRVRAGVNGQAQIVLDDGSLLTLTSGSELSVSAAPNRTVNLRAGGMSLLPANGYARVEALDYVLKTNGLLRLWQCTTGCKDVPGLYGKALSGEVIVEYAGGRSVLRNKPFRAAPGNSRPVILAREPEGMADEHAFDAAVQAKLALAVELRAGMDAFKAGDLEQARSTLLSVLDKSPTEKIVPYYLGLIALERKENDVALKYLQQFTREDPELARERNVGQLVSLLLTNQLQTEVEQALRQERTLTTAKPEPNTIAVQAFSNRGDPAYAALAKGIAAMVITDLSKVPGLKVLERQKVQKLVDEIQLSESGLVTQESLLKAGRLMKAEKVVIGSFGVQ